MVRCRVPDRVHGKLVKSQQSVMEFKASLLHQHRPLGKLSGQLPFLTREGQVWGFILFFKAMLRLGLGWRTATGKGTGWSQVQK